MKRVLIIGIANAVVLGELTKRYQEQGVYLDAIAISSDNDMFLNVNKVFGLPLYTKFKNRKIINKLFLIIEFLYLFIFKLKRNYDTVELHYVYSFYKYLLPIISLRTNKIALIFWGSDIFRSSSRDKNAVNNIVLGSDIINLPTNEIYKQVEEMLVEPEILKNKQVSKCLFGLTNLDLIDNVSVKSKGELLSLLGLNSDLILDKKIVVVAGNANEAQQHSEIIDELCLLRKYDSFHFVFPMTYSGTEEYIRRIEDKLHKSDLSFSILRKFLSNEEVCALRIIGDYYITAQVTDGFSGAFQEHLYVGSIVIAGSWLPYSRASEEGAKFYTFDSFGSLGKVIEDAYLSEEEVQKNREVVSHISKWDSVMLNWMSII